MEADPALARSSSTAVLDAIAGEQIGLTIVANDRNADLEDAFRRLWKVARCPLCGEEHRHDAGTKDEDPDGYLGHVVGHCRPGVPGAQAGYRLVKKPG